MKRKDAEALVNVLEGKLEIVHKAREFYLNGLAKTASHIKAEEIQTWSSYTSYIAVATEETELRTAIKRLRKGLKK